GLPLRREGAAAHVPITYSWLVNRAFRSHRFMQVAVIPNAMNCREPFNFAIHTRPAPRRAAGTAMFAATLMAWCLMFSLGQAAPGAFQQDNVFGNKTLAATNISSFSPVFGKSFTSNTFQAPGSVSHVPAPVTANPLPPPPPRDVWP